MGDRTERTIINHLIETCRDGERGFRTAAGFVNSPETKRLFLRLADQRHEFAEDLLPHANRLGGAADGDGTAFAKAHRTWLHVRARLASDAERVAVKEATRGERYAAAAYDDAVHDMLPPGTRDLVESQDLSVRIAERLVAELVTH